MTIVFVRHYVDYNGKEYNYVRSIDSHHFYLNNDGRVGYFDVQSSHSNEDDAGQYSEIHVGGVCVYKKVVDKTI